MSLYQPMEGAKSSFCSRPDIKIIRTVCALGLENVVFLRPIHFGRAKFVFIRSAPCGEAQPLVTR